MIIFLNTFMTGATVDETIVQQTIRQLKTQTLPESAGRLEKCVRQVAAFWSPEDGSYADFQAFCEKHFLIDPEQLQMTFARFEENLESIYGHNHRISRDLSRPIQLEVGSVLPVDYLFAQQNPFAHLSDDFFRNQIAFVALLNFPLYSLQEKLQSTEAFTRADWAKTRLAEQFSVRVPAAASQQLSKAYVIADDYISNYNIFMHRLIDDKGKRPFPEGLKLISHWGLRDELKAQYGNLQGLARQRMIRDLMRRIVLQEIPERIVNSNEYDWNSKTNKVFKDGKPVAMPFEPNTRYQHLLQIFRAESELDSHYPLFPTKMARRFNQDREIPEHEFEALLITLLNNPVRAQVAELISKRLNRKLEPFDIWYNGFKAKNKIDETYLDGVVAQKYPDVSAFQADLPSILGRLGFTEDTAHFLSGKITVDPSRGVGHATGAQMRSDNAHLRTRIPQTGMKYKGFNIAIHELGHNVEQVFSLNGMDHYLLQGVPNTAFTEAFAFVFQARDLHILGMEQPQDPLEEHLRALDTFWATCEIAAVGLVDMRVWHWMYDHPEADAAQLRDAVVSIAKQVWNQFFAQLFESKDVELLAIYSHMIDAGLYLPDYSLGHIIGFQIERFLEGKDLAQEMERMCKIGRLTPDAWMRAAIGAPLSTEPLLQATRHAVQVMK